VTLYPQGTVHRRHLFTAAYRDCQKNVPVFDRFFLQPYTRLCRVSLIRNKIMKSGIKSALKFRFKQADIIISPRLNSFAFKQL
jgi:hypothetical protein